MEETVMIDGFSYLLGKRSGGGSNVGWTTKNANNIVAVIESLPEEIMIEGKRQIALYGLDDADFDIYHTRLVYLPDSHCYEGHCTLHFFSGGDYVTYVACGYIRLELDEDNLEMETKFCGEYIDGDGLRAPVEFAIDLSALTLVAYKGTPDEIPTYTVTINNVSSPETYGQNCVSYSIDGGNTWIGINEPTIVLKDVTQIMFKDIGGYGGDIKDENGNILADGASYELTYTPTKDTTLDLYISW